ncbi:MAG: DUF2752 domain-containing protein [Verrucomicrobiota bacterium]
MPDLPATSGVTKPWLITTVFWFLGASLFTWANLRMGTSYTICPVKNLTDIPCPTCGGTRALLSLSQGQLSQAFSFNPLITLLLLSSPLLVFVYFSNRQRLVPDRWRPGRAFWIVTLVLVLTNWLFVLKNLP